MPNRKLNRKDFDNYIGSIIEQRKENSKQLKKLEEKQKTLKQIEGFLRNLMRTHSHFPKRNDLRTQCFFSDKEGNPVLIKEFNPTPEESHLPEMPRISSKEAATAKMSNGKNGFVIIISQCNNFNGPQIQKIVVDFEEMTMEIF